MNQFFTHRQADDLVGRAVIAERAHGAILDGMPGLVVAAESTDDGEGDRAVVIVEWSTEHGHERYRYSQWEWHGLLRSADERTQLRHLPG